MQITIVVYQDEDGVFIGQAATLPGVHSFGETLEELEANLQEAIDLYFEVEPREGVPQNVMIKTLEYA